MTNSPPRTSEPARGAAASLSTTLGVSTREADGATEARQQGSSLKARRRRRRQEVRLTTLLLACGIAGVVAARWWASRKATDIQVVADEPGYLSIGRLLAHAGVHWNMGIAGAYSPGYGVLLVPIYWIGGSGAAIYRHVIWLNVALGAVPLLLLYLLARRTTDLSPPLAAIAATVVSLAAAMVAHAGLAWSENLVAAAFLAMLLASLYLVRDPNPRAAVAVALLAPIAYAVHARLLPSAIVALGVIAVVGIQRRLRVRWTLGTLIGGIVLMIGVRKGLAVMEHKLYVHVVAQETIKFSKFTHIGSNLVETAGQFWYLLITTAGLVGFGVVALIQAIWRGTPEPARTTQRAQHPLESAPATGRARHTLDRPQALVIAAQCGIALATSVVFVSGGKRADQIIYGRYNDAVIGPLVLLGIAALCRVRSRGRRAIEAAIVVGATAAMAAVLWHFRQHDLLHGAFIRETVWGLIPFLGASQAVHVWHLTLIGLALTTAIVLVALLRPRVLLLLALIAAAVVGVVRVTPYVSPRPVIGARIANVEQVNDLLPAKSTVLYSFGSGAPLSRFYQYQLHLPWVRFETDLAPHKTTPAATFGMSTDTRIAQSGARLAYIDPYSGIGLWVPPGPLQTTLNGRGELLPPGFPAALPPDATQASVTFTGKPRLVDQGRRITASVRVERTGRGSPWPVYQGLTDASGTVRLSIAVTDPRCQCLVRTGRADFSKMVPPGQHRVNVTVDEVLDRTHSLPPGRYQIQVGLVQERIKAFGVVAQATAPEPG